MTACFNLILMVSMTLLAMLSLYYSRSKLVRQAMHDLQHTYLGMHVHAALSTAEHYVGPYVEQAASVIQPYWQQLYAQTAPHWQAAVAHAQPYVEGAYAVIQPYVHGAHEAVAPIVEPVAAAVHSGMLSLQEHIAWGMSEAQALVKSVLKW